MSSSGASVLQGRAHGETETGLIQVIQYVSTSKAARRTLHIYSTKHFLDSYQIILFETILQSSVFVK